MPSSFCSNSDFLESNNALRVILSAISENVLLVILWFPYSRQSPSSGNNKKKARRFSSSLVSDPQPPPRGQSRIPLKKRHLFAARYGGCCKKRSPHIDNTGKESIHFGPLDINTWRVFWVKAKNANAPLSEDFSLRQMQI